MHRTAFTRIVSAVFALWFAVFTAEPESLHTCPVHDGRRAAFHMDHCPGRRCTAVPIALRAFPWIDAPAELELASSGLPEHEYVAVSRSLLLPFANGPSSQRA
jgi:hypothetical protein